MPSGRSWDRVPKSFAKCASAFFIRSLPRRDLFTPASPTLSVRPSASAIAHALAAAIARCATGGPHHRG